MNMCRTSVYRNSKKDSLNFSDKVVTNFLKIQSKKKLLTYAEQLNSNNWEKIPNNSS